ncbi:hypothetical protein [Empedobacter falsenii]|uniref:Uncharacterized protein n=1 Tax=Empedobacter falsenii TaxID=343874 RepID=A0A427BP83_9FLAO|nr:hypothetical protein [Empedobacter falsenii]RRT91673.1 hypothetical protein EGI89_07795 [Empedobacter falsenii]RRT91902.1 hypothetical protein EGI88_07325 [Empedobacter falsenii]
MFLIFITSCQDGPSARYNEDFIRFDSNKELPYSKLIGKYELDKDSKIRYNLPDSLEFYIELKKDTSLYANRYVSATDRTIVEKEVNSKTYYDKSNKSIIAKDDGINNADYIYIYSVLKTNGLALYVRTRFIPATEKNGMQYKEIDYLRYIKVD